MRNDGNMIKILTESQIGLTQKELDQFPKQEFAKGQYLHGNLEKWNGFDQFRWIEGQPETGIHVVNINNVKIGLAYVWKIDKSGDMRGLVVEITDYKSMDYAFKQYKAFTKYL